MAAAGETGERGVTAAMREAGTGLKSAWRGQIGGAGPGALLANSIRLAISRVLVWVSDGRHRSQRPWRKSGLAMIYKRLEQCGFAWPSVGDGVMRLARVQFEPPFADLGWLRLSGSRAMSRDKSTADARVKQWPNLSKRSGRALART